jgi:hypothetical protein
MSAQSEAINRAILANLKARLYMTAILQKMNTLVPDRRETRVFVNARLRHADAGACTSPRDLADNLPLAPRGKDSIRTVAAMAELEQNPIGFDHPSKKRLSRRLDPRVHVVHLAG